MLRGWPESNGIGGRLGAEYALARLVGRALNVKQNIVAATTFSRKRGDELNTWGSPTYPPLSICLGIIIDVDQQYPIELKITFKDC